MELEEDEEEALKFQSTPSFQAREKEEKGDLPKLHFSFVFPRRRTVTCLRSENLRKEAGRVPVLISGRSRRTRSFVGRGP